ncbi:glycosyltransferase family 4 protein [Pseudomonas sp. 02C 26]|uniref:glycosyltransferase family 4 protein n=1 Tax=Pseudomonas sp. 02C 26 TaxID=2054914 RepID=UPI0021159502|nr:glycosyltransferase family 4 protein [Pseudomonas sp. 02C 26]
MSRVIFCFSVRMYFGGYVANVAMVVWNEFRNDARVLKEAQTLAAAGHHVTVHALHTPGVTHEYERLESGIEVSRVARSPFWKWRKRPSAAPTDAKEGQRSQRPPLSQSGPLPKLSPVRQIMRIAARLWTHAGLFWRMARLRANIIHAHDVNTLPTAWLAARCSGAKLIYDAHEISTSREGYASFRRLVALVEQILMPRVSGTITTTQARAKFFARAYGIPRPIVLQNRPRMQTATRSSRIRDELGLDKAWPIIVYQGGVQQGRGLERLATIAAEVPNAYFVFIGGGRLNQTLHAIVETLALQERVHFIPTVPLAELPTYTASADIGVQPIENTCLNHYTTDSNKLFEYVQAGLPVVASDLPEIRQVVSRHDLGLLVPPGDSAALASALRTLVEDVGKRKHHATQACKAAQVLHWEGQEYELVQLYERVQANMLPMRSSAE